MQNYEPALNSAVSLPPMQLSLLKSTTEPSSESSRALYHDTRRVLSRGASRSGRVPIDDQRWLQAAAPSALSLSSQTSETQGGQAGLSTSGAVRTGRHAISPLTMALASGHEGRCGRQDGLAVLDLMQMQVRR
jgi:hypothetical protein